MKITTHIVELDGSTGEGGGQILRTALSLSAITQTPFHITNIRAGRTKPGLLRQHLTCVDAMKAICNADVEGGEIGSRALRFSPRAIRAGAYRFSIGSAGSATLVLQTVLPALLIAEGNTPSTVAIEGGTHNGMAPPFHFIEQVFVPHLQRMGANVSVRLSRYGFFPAGGGAIEATIHPLSADAASHASTRTHLSAPALHARGAHMGVEAVSVVASVPGSVAVRELQALRALTDIPEASCRIETIANCAGAGNILMITDRYEHATELVSAIGERGVSSEAVANQAARALMQYRASPAPVSEHLADQLLLPYALAIADGAPASGFTATLASAHARTNAGVIEQFLNVKIEINEYDDRVVFSVRPR
jgi:RNA 3'-terminal phosphate cyclase (ATP)